MRRFVLNTGCEAAWELGKSPAVGSALFFVLFRLVVLGLSSKVWVISEFKVKILPYDI